MKISPISAPSTPSPVHTNSQGNSSQQDARARAIAKLMGAPAPTDQNNVPAEELKAVKPEDSQEPKQGESNTTETPEAPEVKADEPKAPSPKEDPQLSSHYANLARKEKALRAQVAQFKAEQAKWQAEREAALKAQPTFDESKYIPRERLKQDALSVLTEEGISYDELTQQILNHSNTQTDPRVLKQIEEANRLAKEAREEAQALKKLYEEAQANTYQQALKQIGNEVNKLVASEGETYEMIRSTESSQDVVELIERTHKEDGILLSIEEACDAVEAHLLEEAEKLSKIEKLRKRLVPSLQQTSPAAQPAKQQEQSQPKPQQKTLSNAMGATKPMSARERAIAAMEGKLK